MSTREEIAAHLRVYAELGVNGVSRDDAWRKREASSGTPNARGRSATALAPHAAPDPAPVPDPTPALDPAPVPDPPPVSDRAPVRDPASALIALRADIGDCTRCPLHAQGRTQVVFGTGNPDADLMFVGEAPGGDEDIQGVPFVGRAGQLLTKIIAAIDFTRDDVYIANVVKCRPPGNRNPEPIEVESCSPFLLRQIQSIRPKVIVALGSFAAQTLLQTKTPITKMRGQVHPFAGDVKVIPTFHPSFLLRNQKNRDMYRDVWNDMKLARALLADPE
jgi:DNA polymerase